MKHLNTVRKFGARVAVVAAPTLLLAAGAHAEAIAFTAPDVDFTAISAWVGGALAAGVLGITVAFKGIDLGKRGIKKA